MTPAETIESFYQAFAAKDGDAMAALYADDATFTDPVFLDLRGKEVGAMWMMLTSRSKDLVVEHRDVVATGNDVRAHWEARYTFSATGRPVHNRIDAAFVVVDGKIKAHKDHFSMWRWSRQALGVKGLLLGFTPAVRKAVQEQAKRGLFLFMKRKRML